MRPSLRLALTVMLGLGALSATHRRRPEPGPLLAYALGGDAQALRVMPTIPST
jgi:hypothetical protein